MKLLRNFYQVGGPSLTHSFDATVYLLKGKEGYYLIDCGTPEGYEQLKININKIGIKPDSILGIFGTHGHYDHVGAALLWKNEFGTKLYLHEADCKQVEQGDGIKTTSILLYGSEFPACTIDARLKERDTFEFEDIKMTIIHTPGHTMGSVCFSLEIAEMKVLVAGDTIWGGFSAHIGSNESIWKESLDKITAMHFDLFTFGHVGPQLIADADTRLKEAKRAFANYYNPWFKTFKETFRY